MSKVKVIGRELHWKCHLPNLFKEIMCNPGTGMLKMPLTLTQNILAELAERCIQVNDPIINEIMCDLQLYETPRIATKEYTSFMKTVRTAADKKRKTLKK
jgi:hypothetical protein